MPQQIMTWRPNSSMSPLSLPQPALSLVSSLEFARALVMTPHNAACMRPVVPRRRQTLQTANCSLDAFTSSNITLVCFADSRRRCMHTEVLQPECLSIEPDSRKSPCCL